LGFVRGRGGERESGRVLSAGGGEVVLREVIAVGGDLAVAVDGLGGRSRTGDELVGAIAAQPSTTVAESPFVIRPGQVVAFAGTAGSVDRTLDDGTRAVVINAAYDQIMIVR
jgi:hypothetical protein